MPPERAKLPAMSLESIIADALQLAEPEVADALALRSVPSWDSLAHMMLIVRLEETFNVQFTGDEIADARTVGDLRRALRAHGADA